MHLKRYFVYSVIYVALVWVALFSLVPENYTLDLLGFSIELPIASWLVMPIALFALLSVLHIAYYGFKGYLSERAIRDDLAMYKMMAKELFLGLESNKDFKTDYFTAPVEVTKALSSEDYEPKFVTEGLKNAYQAAKKVRLGEVVDLKKYKMTKSSPLFIQNEKNKIKADYKHAITILNADKSVQNPLYADAVAALLAHASWEQIHKMGLELSNDDILAIVARYGEEGFEPSIGELSALIIKNHLSVDEYLKLAKTLKTKLAPDALIALFSTLKNEHTSAVEAYFYVLYDLQMIDKLKESLALAEGGNYPRIEALLFLRQSAKMVPANLMYGD